MRITTLQELRKLKKAGEQSLFPPKIRIAVGMASCGIATGAQDVYDALMRETKRQKLAAQVKPAGCGGWCGREPIVNIIIPKGPKLTLGDVRSEDVPEIVQSLKHKKQPIKNVLYRTDREENIIENSAYEYPLNGTFPCSADIPLYSDEDFYKKQHKVALRNSGIIDPLSVAEYAAMGGFLSVYKVLKKLKPDAVIQEVKKSGLRGRGGAGFPTGKKWEITRKTKAFPKYIICNADEGDPGAYMDRSILEGDPYSVLEGMIIGAYAIGASQGFIYVRGEYPLAVKQLKEAIAHLRKAGLLGNNIFGSKFSFDVQIDRGAGAFVCGEETALIASLEGLPGDPVTRPPFPAEKGLWGKPTCINNVETWTNIPVIIARGGKWFARTGSKNSKGTKIFSLVGKVNRVGLIEVPMGMSLREIIFDIGGGVPDGRAFKAVQTGGPSGGCIPKRLLDIPVDYDELKKAGSIMGSGGMIVMDDQTCMVDVAKYFMSFLQDESCGKCLPCREGTKQISEILSRITAGQGQIEDLKHLKKIADTMSQASLCALGRTASNPVLSTLKYFRTEYESHIKDRTCPAGICRDLIQFSINSKNCTGCGTCMKVCPVEAITGENKKPHVIDLKKCIKCRACYEVCSVKPLKAVEIT